MNASDRSGLPPGQQLVARGKWPQVGERAPRADAGPWRVSIDGLVERPLDLTWHELASWPQVEQSVDIHCVTRWSKPGVRFRGVRLAELLAAAGVREEARFISFVARSERDHSTSLVLAEALALETLVALEADGAPLPPAHGGPARVVVPGRYFYKSLKWLARVELLAEDRLGYWEGTAGYHNTGDPLVEQRYVASGISKRDAEDVLNRRDVAGRELRNLAAEGRALAGLQAAGAILRNADFRGSDLRGACFAGANLSNSRFEAADLAGASFRGADVEGADFCQANLRGADLTGASLLGTTFCEEDRQGRAAVVDASTRFDAASLAELLPRQRAFLSSMLPELEDERG
jgi:DMSO/TMAO reductase YedYZ molybdopterin-dependent catalytic subunit